MKKREDVLKQETWDLSSLFNSDKEYKLELEKLIEEVNHFNSEFKDEITDATTINSALKEYQKILLKLTHLSTYVSLQISADQTDQTNLERSGAFGLAMSDIQNKLSFLLNEIKACSNEVLKEAQESESEHALLIEDIIREKPYSLTAKVQDAMTALSPVLSSSYRNYERSKFADMKFDSIEVNGETIPMSFVAYENELEYHDNHAVRHAAFKGFHQKLSEYQNTFASIYQTQVTQEKILSDLKGFDSVFESLLFNQKVSVDMYDRQIDLVMEHLAPQMRKFANLLKDIHGLDKMTYADLKLSVDPEYEPEISVEESKQYLMDGLKVMGKDYTDMVARAFDERWIDFPQNIGKSTGAFCSSPYGDHPYILINWTKKMREVFVLAHEVGHAGHFYLAGQSQNIFDTRASTYFIEAPSTMNELLMANYLKETNNDPRFKRWVLSSMISRTYYHNFVTHLLEAAYQREVYRLVDAKKSISTQTLNNIMKDVLNQFWGEDVELTPGAELTWMRQPHYYMGLYPYTYSAGLTVSTAVSKKVLDGTLDIERWKDVLREGGAKTPLELANMVDVDLSTEKPLMDTINFIGEMIDEIIELTHEINKTK